MTFTYSRTIEKCYSQKHDKYFHSEYDFEYTPDRLEVRAALAEILVDKASTQPLTAEERKVAEKIVEKVISDIDIQEELESLYEDELKEYFKEQAMESERGD